MAVSKPRSIRPKVPFRPVVPVVATLSPATLVTAMVVAVSMVTGMATGPVTLLALSVEVTLRFCKPAASGVAGVMLQLPSAATVAVPMTVVPSAASSLMVSPGVPVPLRVGVVSLVMLSPCVPLSLAGARLADKVPIWTFSSLVLASAVALPAASVTVAVTG